ncbi:MAG: C25 family cysteine peptidase [Candidatus Thorarchaeota archaeon]
MKKVNWFHRELFLKSLAIVFAVMFVISSTSMLQVSNAPSRRVLDVTDLIPQSYQTRPFEVSQVLAQSRVWYAYDNSTPGTPAEAHVTISDTTGITIIADFYGFWRRNVTIDGNTYDALDMPGTTLNHENATPMVPVLSEFVEIPHGVDASIEVLATATAVQNLTGFYIRPASPPQVPLSFVGRLNATHLTDAEIDMTLPTVKGPVYSTDFFPVSEAGIVGGANGSAPALIRGHRLLALNFNPIQYNPLTNETVIHSKIIAKVKYDVPAQIDPIPDSLRSDAYERIMSNLLLNYEPMNMLTGPLAGKTNFTLASDSIPVGKEPGVEYLIITTDDELKVEAERLAEWKTLKGVPAMVETNWETTTDIQDLIRYAYDYWYPAPTYVLLFGDVDRIPTTYNMQHEAEFKKGIARYKYYEPVTVEDSIQRDTGYIASDLGYFNIEGEEYFPDIIYGRISVDNAAEANVIVNKILNYEQFPPDSESFYKGILSASKFEDLNFNGVENPNFPFVYNMERIRHYLEVTYGKEVEYVYSATGDFKDHKYPVQFHDVLDFLNIESDLVVDHPDLGDPNFYWHDGYSDQESFDDSGPMVIGNFTDGKFLVLYYSHGGSNNMIHRFDTNANGWDSENDREIIEGWLSPYFNGDDFSGLDNQEYTPLVVSMACNSGWFDGEVDEAYLDLDTIYGLLGPDPIGQSNPYADHQDESFAELITRYADVDSHDGAVAAIAASRIGYSLNSGHLLDGLIQAFWPGFLGSTNQPIYNMGTALIYGKLYAVQQWGTLHDRQEVPRTTVEVFHLFGDPELELWTDKPEGLVVSYPYTVGTSDPQAFAVTVTKDGTTPVKFAKVCLKQGEHIYEVEYTDGNGQALFELAPSADGTPISIVVTKHNFIPHIGSIPVIDSTAGLEISFSQSSVSHGHEIISVVDNTEIYFFPSGFPYGSNIDVIIDGTVVIPNESPNNAIPWRVKTQKTNYSNVLLVSDTGLAATVFCFQSRVQEYPHDLYMYSQDDESTWGQLKLVWDNPDIKIFREKDGIYKERLRLKQNEPNDIEVTVYNRGYHASGVYATLYYASFGGASTWTKFGKEQIPSLDFGQSTTVTFKNFVPTIPNVCLKVVIDPSREIHEDRSDNVGYENTEVIEMHSPGERSFDVGNPTNSSAYITVKVTQLVQGGDVWNSSILDYTWFRITADTNENARIYLVSPSQEPELGTLFKIELYSDYHLIGGMVFNTTRPEGSLIELVILAGFAVGMVIAVVIIYKRKR